MPGMDQREDDEDEEEEQEMFGEEGEDAEEYNDDIQFTVLDSFSKILQKSPRKIYQEWPKTNL